MKATVVSTKRYEREVARLLSEEERQEMEDAIAENPEAHPVIPGTGGVRKARWSGRGKGRRGGVRLIYFYMITDAMAYLLTLYAKGEKSDLTSEDRKAIRAFVEEIKHAKRSRS